MSGRHRAVARKENEVVNANHQRAVLDRIAAREGIDPASVSVGEKGAVFYRCGEGLMCLCQEGSHYWNEIDAEVIAAQAIKRAARQ